MSQSEFEALGESALADVSSTSSAPREMAQRIAELEKCLATDSLTGAKSRDYFLDRYEDFAAESGAFYFIDLDNFKSVNDHYGHHNGDRLLRRIADSVAQALENDDFVARLGGDEFVVLSKTSQPSDTVRLGERILKACMDAEIGQGELRIRRGASIGCVRLSPSMPAHGAIDLGDTAMREAKELGKNRVHHLNIGGALHLEHRPSMDELQLALERSEIGYFLQPIVSCSDKSVQGYEALLRWERANGQILSPGQFLNTMTQAYAVNARPPLEFARAATEWVTLEQGLFCFFNISMPFLERIAYRSDAWVDDIIGDAPRDRVVFEITEATIQAGLEDVSNTLNRLRDSGIRIALDDFGTGASNLERLQAMAVDIVKIDRRFVRGSHSNAKDRALLAGMIDIAHQAGAQIVVEGIEEEEQFTLAQDLGAEFAQGFHLGRPQPHQRGG